MEPGTSKRCKMGTDLSMNKSILDVNEDCLLHIFSFLNVKDLLQTETVCKKFNYLARDSYRRIKICDSSDGASDLYKILHRIGPYIHTMQSPCITVVFSLTTMKWS